MAEELVTVDTQAAGLVKACVGRGELAAFVRYEAGRLRIVAPDAWSDQLAKLFYSAADEMAARALERK